MNSRRFVVTFSVLMAVVFLASSATMSLGAPPEPEAAPPPGPDTYQIDASDLTADPESPGRTDVAIQGTMWRPEWPRRFSLFKVMGWGVETKHKKTGGDEWVHIAVPLITRLENRMQKIRKVEFCARSTNGKATRPIRMDLWANNKVFKSQAIAWPADNKYHCAAVTFKTPVWKPALGVTVLLHYANPTDKIILYKAWVELRD